MYLMLVYLSLIIVELGDGRVVAEIEVESYVLKKIAIIFLFVVPTIDNFWYHKSVYSP